MALLRRPDGATKNRRRRGRGPGTGNGTTAGRGTKGQNSRSGGGVRPGFEGGQMPLYRRIARRGFSNYPFKIEAEIISLSTLEKVFENKATVTVEALRERKLVGINQKHVKILADGEITKSLTIDGIAVSRGALAKIQAAGGTVLGVELVESEAEQPGTPEQRADSPADEASTDEEAKDNE